MFDGQSCQVCVCNQICDRLSRRELLLKYGPMPVGRSNDPCTRLVQPALYARKGLFEGERVFENARIGPYPNKGGQNRPA